MKDNDLEISNCEGVIDHINTLVRRIGGSEGLRLLMDNILVTQLIENLLGKHIDSAFPAAHYAQREIDDFKKYFVMVNDTLDTMTDYYTKLGAENPAFHCAFTAWSSSTISFADQTMQITFTEKLLRFMCQQGCRTSGTNWH